MIFLSKMVYLGVKYMSANWNYEFLNTGTSSQCRWHTLSLYYLKLQRCPQFRTSKIL